MSDRADDGDALLPVAPEGGAHTALEDLLSIVAHEMRAPLAVVCSAAETAVQRSLEPEQLHRLLQVIRRNAELAMLPAPRW
jgi:signal transduction histidine kinase